MPMVIERPIFRLRACRLGRKPMRAIIASTALRLSADTRAEPLTMRETVLTDTPAARATSVTVTIEESSEKSGEGGDAFLVFTVKENPRISNHHSLHYPYVRPLLYASGMTVPNALFAASPTRSDTTDRLITLDDRRRTIRMTTFSQKSRHARALRGNP